MEYDEGGLGRWKASPVEGAEEDHPALVLHRDDDSTKAMEVLQLEDVISAFLLGLGSPAAPGNERQANDSGAGASWSNVPAIFQYAPTPGNLMEPYASSSSDSETDPSSPGYLSGAQDGGNFKHNIPDPALLPPAEDRTQGRRSLQLNPPGPTALMVARRTDQIPRTNGQRQEPETAECTVASPLPVTPRFCPFHFEMEPKNFELKIQTLDQQLSRAPVIFYIEVKPSQPLYSTSHFIVRVVSPSDFFPVVTVEEDQFQHRYVCSFHATEPGIHFISVCLGGEMRHIGNSPNSFTINRYYVNHPTTPTMTRNLTAGRISLDAPGLVFSGTSKLWGIASDPDSEQIYGADRDGHEVLVFSILNGQIILQARFDAPIPDAGSPFRPTGIHFCRVSKLLYVTDKDNHRVCIFETTGNMVASFGSSGYRDGQFNFPWGVAVSPDGEIIAVADSKNHRLQLFSRFGQFLRKYSVFETNPYEYRSIRNGLDYPRGVCFNDTGSMVFISDFNLQNVIMVDVQTLQSRSSICPARRLVRPQGMAMDAAGNLLICDSRSIGGGAIRVVRPGGILVASIEGTSTSRFQAPTDLTVCRGGYICVVDCGGTLLQIF